MRTRTLSKKDLEGFKVLDCGYCTLYHLIRSDLVEEIGRNTGIYGWNWTAYRVNGTNVIILDSYRNGLRKWFDNFSKVRDELEEIDRRCVKLWAKSEEEKVEILQNLQQLLTFDK